MIDFKDITKEELKMLEQIREQQMPNAIVERKTDNPLFNDLRFNHGFVYLGQRFIQGQEGINFELIEFNSDYDNDEMNIHIGFFSVPQEKRRQGLGTKYLELLCELADKYGYRLDLDIDTKFGTKKNVLKRFYKNCGFEMKNKGNNEEMIRKVSVGATISKRLKEGKL